MNETTILLSPSPGDPNVKPDFLATVEPLSIPRRQSSTSFALPFELVLDGYTREPWSSGGDDQQQQQQHGNDNNGNGWQSCYLISTDGRNRLPGFLQYLKGRKKAALAKFEPTDGDGSGSGGGKSILVVPYDPPPIPPEDFPEGVDPNQVMFVKYLRDENVLKKRGSGDDAKKKQQQMMMLQQQKMQQQKLLQAKQQQQKQQQQRMQQKQIQQSKMPKTATAPPPSNKKGGGGLLGGLLGAQRRTENHLHVVRSSKKAPANPEDLANYDPSTAGGAAGAIHAFRTAISSKLETFKSDPTQHVTKIDVNLSKLIRGVPPDEMDRVTMDVFKFTVHETVEEIGMDKWIAAKEPSEFLDECIFAVYKEGHCPPEILEDLNRGDMPDEVKGQTKFLAEAQSKAMQRRDKKKDEELARQGLMNKGSSGGVVLNTNKRDRRTLEQIQKDMMEGGEDAKRSRFD